MAAIRRLTPTDWTLWKQVRLAALADSPAAFGSALVEWVEAPQERWELRLLDVPLNLVAMTGNRAIGQVGATSPNAVGQVELISLWVAPSERGTGIGDALIEAVTSWVGRQEATEIVLYVKLTNGPARRLYERHGFATSGPGGAADEVRMVRPMVDTPFEDADAETARELRARAHAGRAVRDLGHALVGHDNPEGDLERVAQAVEQMAAQLVEGSLRARPGRDMQNRGTEPPPDDGSVFVSYPDRPISGAASPWGVDLEVQRDGDGVVGRCTLRAAHEGAPGRSHGGVIAAVFDDLFGFVLAVHQVAAFTGELTVRYLAPAPLHTPLVFRARLVGRERRKLLMEADASADAGAFATAHATFVEMLDPAW